MALGKGIPVINGFDLNSKLPLDSRTVADTLEEMNALVTNGSVGDGQLCYCKADKKLYVLKDNAWSEVGGGGGIPIVEGTTNDETMEITIPEAQTSDFILHVADMGSYLYMSVFSGYYGCYMPVENVIYIFSGEETTINLKITPVSLPVISGTYDSTQEKITLDTASDSPFILIINGLGKFLIDVMEGMYCSVIDISQDGASVNELTITLLRGANTTINVIRYKVSNTLTETISLFGKHSILVPKDSADTSILPCTASDNGKVLSVVNGEAQWAKASGGVTITFED